MTKNWLYLSSLLLVLVWCSISTAAQSTADVPVTKKIMSEARKKVLGAGAVLPAESKEYVIGHGDILSVQVYGEGDMSITVPQLPRDEAREDGLRQSVGGVMVRIDGRISLKHIGDINAVGYTLTQLADYLKELYVTVYDDPIVTVVLVQSNSQRYTIMGKVLRPGIYHLDFPVNIVQAIARSGGFTEWANSDITLIRKESREKRALFKGKKIIFDYDDFLDGKKLEKNVLIKPGDIIIVH